MDPKNILIVGGRGEMGRRLGKDLAARGHRIDVLEADDGRDRPGAVRAADVTVIAVPMAAAVDVVDELAPHVRPDALLCDINSLKEEVCAAMSARCPGQAVGLHPMFGPTVHSLRHQKIVVCPVRPGPLADWLRAELTDLGLEVIETDPVTHDRMMAVVQVLVHFNTLVMGEALRSTGVGVDESLRFTSPIYRLELAFVGRLYAQDPALYAEILMRNPRSREVRRALLDAAAKADGIVQTGDREAFSEWFATVGDYFRGFADEAMRLSDRIIDGMTAEP